MKCNNIYENTENAENAKQIPERFKRLKRLGNSLEYSRHPSSD